MFRCSRLVTFRRLLIISFAIACIIICKHFPMLSSLPNVESAHHKSTVYNLSSPFVMTNIIDQFLHTNDYNERNALWSLIVQSWSKSFERYSENSRKLCPSTPLPFDFIHEYLNRYSNKLLTDYSEFQTRLTAFGLFFYYNPKEIHSKTHRILKNMFLSSCNYLELIVLIIKVQYVILELNIDYFIGKNTLLGAMRHHDIVPWHSIVEFNLPLTSKMKFIKKIQQAFHLGIHKVDEAYAHKQQNDYIYKVFNEEKRWPQIEIYFYAENSTHIFDSNNEDESMMKIGYLQKSDVFPFQLRPFGPTLLNSIRKPQAMISFEQFNNCTSVSWNHQLGKPIGTDQQYQIPCEQLRHVYSFVQSRKSWRLGYCEETLLTQRSPHRILSYFRYNCQKNMTH